MNPTDGHTPHRHVRRRLVTRNKKSQGEWFKKGKKKGLIFQMLTHSYAQERNFYSYSEARG